MTKEGAIACLKGNNYSAHEVKNLIRQIEIKERFRLPKYLKRGDMYTAEAGGGLNSAGQIKKRPCVIISVKGDAVFAIPLTSTENGLCLIKSRYRFGIDGWFTKQIISSTKEYAMNNFCGVYDNEKLLRKAVRELKEFINSNL